MLKGKFVANVSEENKKTSKFMIQLSQIKEKATVNSERNQTNQ